MKKELYLKMFKEGFKESRLKNRNQYLCNYIFQLTTYDSDLSDFLGKKSTEVLKAIHNSDNFEYIKDEDNYKWYIVICNFDFFAYRIEWGSSIRGAWFDFKQKDFESTGLFLNGRQVDSISFEKEEDWKMFCEAIIEFSEK